MLNSILSNFWQTEYPPTRVLQVKPDLFSERHIICREDGLVLYAPASNNKNQKLKYEIVLHKPWNESLHYAYSLFRSEIQADAEEKFIYMKDKIPAFIEISKDASTQGLQKLCDILTEHPSWTLAHLAAHFAMHDSFNNPKINSFLNSSDVTTGMSPLQVAISTLNLKTVQTLLAAKCSVEHLDLNGNSICHHAASSNKEIISALIKDTPPQCLNAQNKMGYTPLHLACIGDKPECVRALLLAGADVNIQAGCNSPGTQNSEPGYVGQYLQNNPKTLSDQDMKYGGTPLHWAVSRDVIDALVEVKCKINAVNFQNRTALHVMVSRNKLQCVVALLSREAETDLVDCDGNTALHLAVSENNISISILHSLIVFGADLNLLNNKGESPRHLVSKSNNAKALYCLHAVGARRCPAGKGGCTHGCIYGGDYNGEPPPQVVGPTNRSILNQMLAVATMESASQKSGSALKKGRLLCLDGGGIRGLVLVQLLMALETAIGKPIVHCFDWITGTSTGGILALGLATGRSLKECHCTYFRLKERTFVGMRPYPSEPLETILKDTLGTDTVMTDIKEPKIIIPAVLADRKPVELHLFRNYESASKLLDIDHVAPYELPPPPEEVLLWHVARATGAAPTYFSAFDRFLDGGLIANNPTLDALTEIQEYNLALRAKARGHEAHPVSIVVSLGTGLIPVTQSNMSKLLPESLWEGAKLVFKVQTLVSLLVDQATMADGRVVDRARAWCASVGIPYFRFNPQMSLDVNMDENSDEILCNMLWETKAYMQANMAAVKEVADLLNAE